ncbi:piggyBac transposable element-derived protein 4-like [Lineus longissimus]|uniref:piggyBac transposable element-derived protein 4-like n=1 Tax=Lineus longissimus TaxID=88925 RepID=UPI00315D819C
MAAPKKVRRVLDDNLLEQILDSDNELSDYVSSNDDDEPYAQNASNLDATSQSGDDMPDNASSDSGSDGSIGHVLGGRRGNQVQARVIQNQPAWTENGQRRDRFQFTAVPGLKANVADKDDQVQYFELFFDDDILAVIVEQTNLYAAQFIDERRGQEKRRSRYKQWQDTNSDEIRVLLALLFLQGIIQKPDNQMYFSKRQSIATPFFSDIMLCDCFLLLCKFLHFADNTMMDPGIPNVSRKLYKLYPILNHLRQKFKSVYQPEQEIAIDESLMMWKGRLGWKQYIPSKRARFGIKSYELCESQSGYIWDFFIYTGQDTEYRSEYRDNPSMGAKVVLSLAHPLLDQGYGINMDNFFSSPVLFDFLCQHETDAVGTIRSNRKGLPVQMKQKRLKKGESCEYYRGKLMALKWRDKKDVHMLSTYHNGTKVDVRQRGDKVASKPQVCLTYNDTMGGVDLSDAYLVCYPSVRKRLKKYYQKQFRHLVDMSALNAYLLYKKQGGKMDRLTFQLDLIEGILAKYKQGAPAKPRRGRPPHGEMPQRLSERHFPSHIPPTPKKDKPTRRCVVCQSRKKREESSYYCRKCDKALCAAPCFELYHTLVRYNTDILPNPADESDGSGDMDVSDQDD